MNNRDIIKISIGSVFNNIVRKITNPAIINTFFSDKIRIYLK